jgi:hypothetical protein
MLKIVLIAVAATVVVLATVVALRPSELRVARSTTMAAPPETVFAQVNDFHAWEAWNPWGRIDPDMESTYSGAAAGPGAQYAWVGNREVGEGRMTIIESRPGELVRIRLEFLSPFAATNTAELTFRPEGDRTAVTWSMHGHNSFIAKAIGLLMDMDQMIGGQFEKGLADLKAIVETTARR